MTTVAESPKCDMEHTDVDPQPEDFNCPRCREGFGRKFGVTNKGSVAKYGCEKLHKQDVVSCDVCKWQGTGEIWVKAYAEAEAIRADERLYEGKKGCGCEECNGWGNEGTKWMVEYASRQIGPFTLSVRKQVDGGFTWAIGWKTSSAALAGGKSPTYAEAQEAAEDAVENWIDDAQGDL